MDLLPPLFTMFLMAVPPPERYDYEYKGELTILRLSKEEANRRCDALRTSRTGSVAGCTLRYSDMKCTIILNRESVINEASLLRHEVAHCNGWPAHHPR